MATEVGISPGGNGRGLGSNAGNGGVGIGASGAETKGLLVLEMGTSE